MRIGVVKQIHRAWFLCKNEKMKQKFNNYQVKLSRQIAPKLKLSLENPFSTENFVYFFNISDSNLTQTQILTKIRAAEPGAKHFFWSRSYKKFTSSSSDFSETKNLARAKQLPIWLLKT